ncbi:hypothetical protein [Frigoriglobus tundricola]|uniref:Glycosyltransferase RgtA/B/C/D-like domain-containing protein n=1 Tax=Frigoriglobus tundricola TaxID=2774151 RepID=A0A6M5YNF5_9BACT|nr:hypothetical protein [Frigoriglobus tundricola]QJW95074.1 hypothetical protein FTUN_2600 [Frigoriglobus tundricola]
MNTYGWLLLGQTLLALLALGLCGGWALRAFRRDDRPFLWLAAPLAGVFTLGGALAVLYFFGGLPLRWCLWSGLALNAGATVIALVYGRAALPTLGDRTAATVVALAAAYWGTVSCNKTAIDAREPTLAVMDGSDMFGYAIASDWLRTRAAATPPRTTEPLEGLSYHNLYCECSRPVAFLLVAAAAEARGTTSLFSYDWATGVVLAAGLIGLAGLFARNPLVLALLALGAATSSWLTNARTGYMGKSLGYPGGMLLTALFFTALDGPTRARCALVALLCVAVGWSLSPLFPVVLFAILLGGYAVALALLFVRTRWDPDPAGVWPAVARPLLSAALLGALTSVPSFVVYRYAFGSFPPPPPPTDWGWVIPVALDLDMPTLKAITAGTQTWLLYGCALTLFSGLVAGLWQRNLAAVALLACALCVPFAWAAGELRLYTFHGLIYPLTLAGAAALAAPRPRRPTEPEPAPAEPAGGRSLWGTVARVGVAAALLIGMTGLRVPQIRASASRYVYAPQPLRVVQRLSEARALCEAIGPDGVDVALAHVADNHMVWAELAARGVPVRFRSPGWDVSVGAYAGPKPAYDLFAPKARFSLLERRAWAQPGAERWAGARLKLVDDVGGLAVVGITRAQATNWDGEWRPGVWIGNAPTTFLIHNGTGQPQAVRFRADTVAGPGHPDPDRPTLRYRLGDRSGTLALPKASRADIPLSLAPGLNRVELFAEEPAEPAPGPTAPVLLLEFRNWRLDPG